MALIDILVGGIAGSLLAWWVLMAILVFFGVYVYFAFAWRVIARKLNYNRPWFAWIPFLNVAMVLQLGRFHWAWVFLSLIPVLGWLALGVLLIIASWRIFEQRMYPGWFSLSTLVPQIGGILYMIAIGFVAWKDRKEPMFK